MDVKSRIGLMKPAELGQKDSLQGGFVGPDGHRAVLQTLVAGKLGLTHLQLLVGQSHMGKQLFSLRGQRDPTVGTDHQSAAQLLLQIVHAARNIGLTAHQSLRGLCKTFIFCNKIKNPVILIIDCYDDPSLVWHRNWPFNALIILICYDENCKYAFYIFRRVYYNIAAQ